jgi:hypothetical protein
MLYMLFILLLEAFSFAFKTWLTYNCRARLAQIKQKQAANIVARAKPLGSKSPSLFKE